MAIKFNMGESRDISVITAGGRKPNVDFYTAKITAKKLGKLH